MKNIEMHCHSTLSDGKNTPQEIVKEARRLNMDFLTLTDHDTISPQEFQSSLRDNGIATCDSVEISSRNFDLNKSLHLVSYSTIFSDSLHDILNSSCTGKMNMKWGQFDDLITRHGFLGNREEFDTFMRLKLGREPETSNKYDMSHYLMTYPDNRSKAKEALGNLCTSDDIVLHFYLECLKREGNLYNVYGYEVPEYEPGVRKVVDEVTVKSGGMVSMAHPNVTFMGGKGEIPEFKRTISDYVKKGVRGIEVNSIASWEWVQAILEARQKYDLILTFGSDCHHIGKTDKKHSTIGRINPFIDTETYERQFGKFQEQLGI